MEVAGSNLVPPNLHVTNPPAFQTVRTTLALLTAIHGLWPSEFAWRDPLYKDARVKRPIDILFGNCRFGEAFERNAVQRRANLDDLLFLDKAGWRNQVTDHLLPGWSVNNREA